MQPPRPQIEKRSETKFILAQFTCLRPEELFAPYYALFHLLVDEATKLMLAGNVRGPLRDSLARAFHHSAMKQTAVAFTRRSIPPEARNRSRPQTGSTAADRRRHRLRPASGSPTRCGLQPRSPLYPAGGARPRRLGRTGVSGLAPGAW